MLNSYDGTKKDIFYFYKNTKRRILYVSISNFNVHFNNIIFIF
jgi:hypothetical protein